METDAQPARAWRWFVAWMLVGGLYALSLLGMLTIGIFVLPIPVVATVLLVRRQKAGRGTLGLVAGIALPLLYVSLLNRDGPGMICSAIEGGTACTEEMSPWPWLAAGLAFMALGISAFWFMRPRPAPPVPQVIPEGTGTCQDVGDLRFGLSSTAAHTSRWASGSRLGRSPTA